MRGYEVRPEVVDEPVGVDTLQEHRATARVDDLRKRGRAADGADVRNESEGKVAAAGVEVVVAPNAELSPTSARMNARQSVTSRTGQARRQARPVTSN